MKKDDATNLVNTVCALLAVGLGLGSVFVRAFVMQCAWSWHVSPVPYWSVLCTVYLLGVAVQEGRVVVPDTKGPAYLGAQLGAYFSYGVALFFAWVCS